MGIGIAVLHEDSDVSRIQAARHVIVLLTVLFVFFALVQQVMSVLILIRKTGAPTSTPPDPRCLKAETHKRYKFPGFQTCRLEGRLGRLGLRAACRNCNN